MAEVVVQWIGLLWAAALGAIIVAPIAYAAGMRRQRRDAVVRIQSKEMQVIVERAVIDKLLDRYGMIAQPKGFDFRPRGKTRCH